jgi:hypothetical protein
MGMDRVYRLEKEQYDKGLKASPSGTRMDAYQNLKGHTT